MIRIVTDSTCDIKRETCNKRGITVIPLNVHFKKNSFKDMVELSSETFFNLLKTEPDFPKTSQPSPQDFINTYEGLLDRGDEIVSIHISSKMSGTFQAAEIAKKELRSEKIHILDSGLVSIALGMAVLESSMLLEKGGRVKDIIETVRFFEQNIRSYFIVDTLEYLHKGGRIGKAASLAGSILNIKPILTISDGEIGIFEKKRGTVKAIERLAHLFSEYRIGLDYGKLRLGFAYGGERKLLDLLLGRIRNSGYSFEEDELINQLGPVVGTHSGPGTVVMCYINLPN